MLGLFLSSKDTFGTLVQQLDTKPQIAVGPSAQFINNYYTAGMATAPEPKKPTVAIPQPVIEALDNLLWAALLRWAFPEQRRSMIRMLGWVQMASARSSNAARSLWWLGTSVAMS